MRFTTTLAVAAAIAAVAHAQESAPSVAVDSDKNVVLTVSVWVTRRPHALAAWQRSAQCIWMLPHVTIC